MPDTGTRRLAVTLVALAFGLLWAAPDVSASGPAVDLGASGSFAVLAGGGVTDTGPSAITGEVGTHPLPTVSNLVDHEATAAVHRADAAAARAQAALAAGYDVAAAMHGTVVAGSALGGMTLAPGVFTAGGDALDLAGTLTLDGHNQPDAAWIIQVAGDLVTAPASVIRLVNGARSCNVYWQVAGSATLGAGSTFVGSILAMTSVTILAGVMLDGRALARQARVTLAGATITIPSCSGPGAPSSSTVAAGRPVALAASSSAVASVAEPRHGSPPIAPIAAIVAVVAAVVLGERRQPRRSAVDRWWRGDSP